MLNNIIFVRILIISLRGFGIGIISYLHYDMTGLRNIDYRFCFICFALFVLHYIPYVRVIKIEPIRGCFNVNRTNTLTTSHNISYVKKYNKKVGNLTHFFLSI